MGLSLVRHIPFFYFGCLAILPRYLDHVGEFCGRFIKPPWMLVARVVLLVGVVGFFWLLYQPLYRIYGPFTTGLREWHYPIEATEFVREQKLPANIYNTYDWGGRIQDVLGRPADFKRNVPVGLGRDGRQARLGTDSE
ncbi:MAG: hypothetical protein P8Y84_08550 [Desulfuromonadales bacterium]